MDLNDKIVIYQTKDGKTAIDVKLENDTVWLSANQMAALFERDEKTIRKHINNVFSENELEKKNNTHFLRVDGVKQSVAFYSLDGQRGTQFRIWANRIHLRPETVCRKLSNLKKRRLFCLSTLTSKSPRAIDNFSNPLKFCKLCYS